MRTKVVVVVLTALLAMYVVLLGQRAAWLVATGEPVAVVMGVALFALPLVVVWTIVRELRFGAATEAMADELAAQGRLPVDDLPRTPGGRVEREAADAAFATYRAETEAAPQDWGAWFRLSCAYDVARDRKRARGAMRQAIALRRG